MAPPFMGDKEMVLTYDYVRKPLNWKGSYDFGDSSNYHETIFWVAGCTDLLFKIKNTDGAQGITISVDWALDIADSGADGFTDAIGSDPTVAASGIDIYKFSNKYFVVNDGTNDHNPTDPAFAGVLPCSFIKIKVYATTGTESSSCKIWVQGIKQRL